MGLRETLDKLDEIDARARGMTVAEYREKILKPREQFRQRMIDAVRANRGISTYQLKKIVAPEMSRREWFRIMDKYRPIDIVWSAELKGYDIRKGAQNPSSPKYMRLSEIKKYEPQMRRLGVSTVARSPRGFLTAYKKAGGRPDRLSAYWRRRRDNFVARHLAQVKKRGEPMRKGGGYSRRALALIAWAWKPVVRS